MRKFVITLLNVFLIQAVFAADSYDPTAKGEVMLENAVAYLNKNGKEKALREFNSQTGKFTGQSWHVSVFDIRGQILADGINPARIGMNIYQYDDDSEENYNDAEEIYIEKVGDLIVVCSHKSQPPKLVVHQD